MNSRPTLTAAEAAARLKVSRSTLYAYVSRGLLNAHRAAEGRESRYSAFEVERLAASRARGRAPGEVAKAALDFGAPVLSSGISLLREGRLYYRGYDAVAVSETATLEEAAALLWDLPQESAFPTEALLGRKPEGENLLLRFLSSTRDEPTALWLTDAARLAEGCGALLRSMASAVLDAPPVAAQIHLQCAKVWRLDDDGAGLIRRALVLCADHELNASSFTARCVASTGASVRAAVLAGLAALSGPRHGGMTQRVESFWNGVASDPSGGLRQHLAGGEALPGFGHPLYPTGDVRAAAILSSLRCSRTEWQNWVTEAEALTGLKPNLDFALVALRRHLGLPPGAAYALFALARTAGWIAHALEQRASGQLIRPRAIYNGPMPE